MALITDLVDKLIEFLPKDLQDKAKASRKAIVTGLGSLLTVLTLVNTRFGWLIPAQYRKPIAVVIGLLTTIMTYTTPNEEPSSLAA